MRQPLEYLIVQYQKSLFVAAFNICGNSDDANDMVQETFIQYHVSGKDFNDEEHIKSWLLRVVINKSKNLTRSFWRRNKVSMEEIGDNVVFESGEKESLYEEVKKHPEKYRIIIHLFYYEDYSAAQIAQILEMSEAAVKMRLSRGRNMLRDVLKEG